MPMTLETETVWREFHERLRAFVSRRVPRVADVEDILQEVFLRIHRSLSSVQKPERLPAWIFQITRNAITDHYRAARQEPVLTVTEEREEMNELAACIQPMVATLPAIYRDAVVSTDLKGLTQLEAAEQSGISFSGMKSRVQRGRRELKRMLLECCRVELDRRGGVVDYAVRDGCESPCGRCGGGG